MMKYDGTCGACMFYSWCDCGEPDCDRNMCSVRYVHTKGGDKCHYPALRVLAHMEQSLDMSPYDQIVATLICNAVVETVTMHQKRKRYECQLCHAHAKEIGNVAHQGWCMLGEWIREYSTQKGE